jgi:nicotinamide mononucleotide transporter
MSAIEIFATLFGLISVYLTVRQNIWCWPTGLVMVVLYIFIFFNVRLYSDMGLQIFYVFMQFYGWYNWKFGNKNKGDDLPVTRLTGKSIAVWIAAIAIANFALGYAMSYYTNASFPYLDAFATVTSLAAQWFLTVKVLESWVLWITVDVISIGIYALKGLYLTSGLYAVFLALAILGLLKWYKSFIETTVWNQKLQPQEVSS